MSRSNNTDLINPARKHFEWDGTDGGFRYYDKALEKRIPVPLPFSFLVLDCLSSVRGFSDTDQSGFWSNEVRDLKKEIITVRNKKGTCAKGLYEEVIKDRNTVGAKYCQSVYIAYYENEELIIGNLALLGAALSAWIDFRKKSKIYEGAIMVKNQIEGKKGKTVYQIPVFTMAKVSEESDLLAKELDKELQEYFTAYFKRTTEEKIIETEEKVLKEEIPLPSEEHVPVEEPVDDLPF